MNSFNNDHVGQEITFRKWSDQQVMQDNSHHLYEQHEFTFINL